MRYKVVVEFGRGFVEERKGDILVGVDSKPKQGRANRELVKRLAKHFGVPTSNIKIISGFRSRNKIVEILVSDL